VSYTENNCPCEPSTFSIGLIDPDPASVAVLSVDRDTTNDPVIDPVPMTCNELETIREPVTLLVPITLEELDIIKEPVTELVPITCSVKDEVQADEVKIDPAILDGFLKIKEPDIVSLPNKFNKLLFSGIDDVVGGVNKNDESPAKTLALLY
jgi:hypothetical protein